MPAKLSTLLEKVKNFKDKENAELIQRFYEFVKSNSSSENHIINNPKAIINFENLFQSKKALKEIKRQDVVKFLDSITGSVNLTKYLFVMIIHKQIGPKLMGRLMFVLVNIQLERFFM